MRRFLRENGLTLVVLALFLVFMAGQTLMGAEQFNEERREHGDPAIGLRDYLRSGHFWEATAENWESEFLQMAAYVLLTIGLYQRGSSESKDPGKKDPVERDPRTLTAAERRAAPLPVRRGGWRLRLYEHSLSLAFLLLFLASFMLHAVGGVSAHNAEQLQHGGETLSVFEFVGSSQFWFESFQNWQSEFLSLVAMVFLSIWLRQRGSPESKPVHAPHRHTGSH
jgi:hypothetical protein